MSVHSYLDYFVWQTEHELLAWLRRTSGESQRAALNLLIALRRRRCTDLAEVVADVGMEIGEAEAIWASYDKQGLTGLLDARSTRVTSR